MFSDNPSPLPFWELPFKRLLQTIQHPDTFFISSAIGCVDFRGNVTFLFCHKQMVYRLRSLAPTPIHSFNFITDMTIVIFLGELCRGAVGRAANLSADFVPLLRRPIVTQITELNMEATKLLIDF